MLHDKSLQKKFFLLFSPLAREKNDGISFKNGEYIPLISTYDGLLATQKHFAGYYMQKRVWENHLETIYCHRIGLIFITRRLLTV